LYIGIDVGGTYTDAVLLDKSMVLAMAKIPTRENLLFSLVEAFDRIIKQGVPVERIERVVFSTTMITNLIVEKKYDQVGLLIMPGPGLNYKSYNFPIDTYIINGAIDYRGREITPIDFSQVDEAISDIKAKKYNKIAIVGKFSCRNNIHENSIEKYLKSKIPDCYCEMGHKVAGQLNFPRRVISTYLACATREKYQAFISSVEEALAQRKIHTPVFVLKADGGTLPLSYSPEMAIETIFSGPAASTLGVQALTPPGETCVVVDIGGTTTDLALVLNGQPLLSSKGARINDFLTHVRTLSVKSVPIGGDSAVGLAGKDITISPERKGLPYCLGGPVPTPTDALRLLGLTQLGDQEKALEAMKILGDTLAKDAEEVARTIVSMVSEIVAREIDLMFAQWEQEPAYRVWEVLQKRKVRPDTVAGVGGGAAGLVDQIAARIGCSSSIPPYAPVANAIGAAVAKPTSRITLRVDTQQEIYSILEEGCQNRLKDCDLSEDKAIKLAKEWLYRRIAKLGLEKDLNELEVTRHEVFNVVRNWTTVGRIYDIAVQSQRGITGHIGIEVNNHGACQNGGSFFSSL